MILASKCCSSRLSREEKLRYVLQNMNGWTDFVYFISIRCSICLGEYQDKEMLRIMPICRHNFHLICIDVWLQKHSTCPICRLPLNMHEARFESPFESSLQVHGVEFSDDRTGLLPIHQRSGSSSSNRETHETVPEGFGDPIVEHESGT